MSLCLTPEGVPAQSQARKNGPAKVQEGQIYQGASRLSTQSALRFPGVAPDNPGKNRFVLRLYFTLLRGILPNPYSAGVAQW